MQPAGRPQARQQALLMRACMCRLVLQKLEVALSVDAIVTATRAYLERSLRELFAKGPSGAAPAEDGPDSLQGQLATLGSWHSWLLGHLRHFKVCSHGKVSARPSPQPPFFSLPRA